MTNRETDEIACLAFTKFCRPWGFARKQDPDIHIDYVVELRDGDRPTGQNIAVQVKGTTVPIISEGRISKSMAVQHLKYYLDDLKMPVFIVVVDVNSESIYWVFAQEFLRSTSTNWRNQETLTVHAMQPTAPEHVLPSEVELALRYMQRLHPGTLPDAARKLKESLEKEDPRFVATPEFRGGETHITFHAKSTIQGQLKLLDPGVQKKYRHAIESGEQVEFNPGELAFDGSKLFHGLISGRQGPFKLRAQKAIDCECALVDPTNEIMIIRHRPARIVGGTTVGVLDVEYGGGAFSVGADIDVQASMNAPDGKCRVRFCYDKWVGKGVQVLSDFEGITRFAMHVAKGGRAAVECEIDEKKVWAAELSVGSMQADFRKIAGILSLLSSLRMLSTHCGASIQVPSLRQLGKEEDLLVRLPEMIEKGHVTYGPGVEVEVAIEVSSASRLLAALGEANGFTEVIKNETLLEGFAGAPSQWVVRNEIRNIALEKGECERLHALGDGSATARFVHTERTTLRRSLVRVGTIDSDSA
jgi:uncharacterized protein DUF4365